MDVSLKYNRQMRSIFIATAVAIFAAVAAMFIPVAILESVTGSTGLSEMIPATAAPLGDTARALIAFGTGALTLATMAVVLLGTDRKPVARVFEDEPAIEVDEEYEDDEDVRPSLMERLGNFKLPAISAPKWPWQKDEDDITEFADLPKLRGNDIHPDAPPRRPLSATADLPVLGLAGTQISAEIDDQHDAMADAVEVDATPAYAPLATEQYSGDNQPLITDMVAQLEAAVAKRQQQLKELEGVAALLASSQRDEAAADAAQATVSEAEAEESMSPAPTRIQRPPLEAVPSAPVQQDDMDEALAAALATLHRMNGTDR